MRRFPWAWPLAALITGISLGLAGAWIVIPNRESGSPPRSLRSDYKDQWREAIAASYAATGDLERARIRLNLLGAEDVVQTLSAQAQRALASGQPFEAAQELARLASDLQAGVSSIPSRTRVAVDATAPAKGTLTPGGSPTTIQSGSGTPTQLATASPSALPLATSSPFPNPTVIPSPSAPFRVVSQDKVCDPNAKPGLLQVTVLDAHSSPMPGIEITITWDQGADRFFTGFQPEISPGYADYTMVGGKTYSVQVARMGLPLSGIAAPLCTATDSRTYLGGLQLTFSAP